MSKVYEIVTEKIIQGLEKGNIPWRKPWAGGSGLPLNLKTKKPYRGVNVWLLGMKDFSSPYWLTFKQCNELGGKVKKGARSSEVTFWKPITVKGEEETEEREVPILRYYRVFNVEQCEIPEEKMPKAPERKKFQPIEKCEKTVAEMQNPPSIGHGGNRAYYSPDKDSVQMPEKESFSEPEFYYSVLFHELGHATGAKKRLNRKDFEAGCFGSETYSKEELVAEMTASFLCGVHEIENITLENSATYIKSWLKKLRDDKRLVVFAAAQAQKAADYIQNIKFEKKTEE